MKKTTKKLAFSAETVRQLQQSMTDEELQGVAGETIQVQLQPQPSPDLGGFGAIIKPRGGVTTGCPSIGDGGPLPGAC